MLEALLLLALLATGGSALVPSLRAFLGRFLVGPRPRRCEARRPPRRPAARLEAHGLTKRFGGVIAADDVSLEIRTGTITALVGPNGSGKTTVLRLVGGTLEPDAGTVALGGRDLTATASQARVASGLVRTLQSRAVFDELTALESVLVGVDRTRRDGGAVRALTSTPRYRAESRRADGHALAVLETVGLADRADRPASELTGSDRQRLMIAAALGTNPTTLLLDEPSAGASDEDLRRLAELLLAIRGDGLGILLVEHNLKLVRAVADEVLELDHGRVHPGGRL
jgi:ABC-type branched-subunit amino acid transport system ATPase component